MWRRIEDICPCAPRGSTAWLGQGGGVRRPQDRHGGQLRAGPPGAGGVDHQEHIPLAIWSDFKSKSALKEKGVG